jgi:hypothetical protein
MKKPVDVSGGKMTLEQVYCEIRDVFFIHKPSEMVVEIKRRKDGYHTTIYISEKDFLKRG